MPADFLRACFAQVWLLGRRRLVVGSKIGTLGLKTPPVSQAFLVRQGSLVTRGGGLTCAWAKLWLGAQSPAQRLNPGLGWPQHPPSTSQTSSSRSSTSTYPYLPFPNCKQAKTRPPKWPRSSRSGCPWVAVAPILALALPLSPSF